MKIDSFASLHYGYSGADPVTLQNDAKKQLPKVLANNGLSFWSPDDPFPQTGTRLLLGVASWNLYDLVLLDLLVEAISDRSSDKDIVLQAFDVDLCRSPQDVTRFIPHLAASYSLPFIGIWQDGNPTDAADGKRARDTCLDLFDISTNTFQTAFNSATECRRRSFLGQ